MINPLEEVYIIFEKSSGDLKTGDGLATVPQTNGVLPSTNSLRRRKLDRD